jgi:hypothetical protein
MSWTHLGMYDFNLIGFIVLAALVVAGLLVLRSTTAPVHERIAFAGFVIVEMVIASGQFWDTVFGDGRTYIDCFLLAVIQWMRDRLPRGLPIPVSVTTVDVAARLNTHFRRP